VSVGCPDSEPHCFCRINSISRGQFCVWRAHTSDETEDKCRSRLGYGQGNTDAWYNECLSNHASAWHSDYNDHFSAKLFSVLKVLSPLLGESATLAITTMALDAHALCNTAASKRLATRLFHPPPLKISHILRSQDAGISKQSSASDIENALYSELGLSASDVAKFC
jgi:hypothetical protein